MKHLGDITKINGAQIQPVDVITFGSPCQDLSIAGKRAGLAGERSGLFMEAVRVIKEMRNATNGEYPKYAVWENVYGAFSSNGGEDFRAVLEELARIRQNDISIPGPSGKWCSRGGVSSNDWSLAWRTMDAQYWGVPQRRKRIALVADFTGQRAGEILFEPESVRGHFATCRSEGQGTARTAEASAERVHREATTVDAADFRHINEPVYCIQGNIIDRADTAGANGVGVRRDKSYTLNTIDRPAVVYDARGNGNGTIVPTLTGDHESRITDYTAITLEGQTLAGTLQARDYKGVGRCDTFGRVIVQRIAYWIVRRLTPLECERLQGFPDGWTDIGEWTDSKGKRHKYADAPRYKALGNSIALPQWYYVLGGLADRLPNDATLGSLFDGIGGFPYVWAELHNGDKSLCVWASEIEEFPIAVTKKWFPDETVKAI